MASTFDRKPTGRGASMKFGIEIEPRRRPCRGVRGAIISIPAGGATASPAEVRGAIISIPAGGATRPLDRRAAGVRGTIISIPAGGPE